MKHVKLFESFVNEEEAKYPFIEKIASLLWDGDVETEEALENSEFSAEEIKTLELFLQENWAYFEEWDGVPFKGDEKIWDDMLNTLDGAKILQKFIELNEKISEKNENDPLNESVMDILQQAMSLLTDKTVVNVAGDMMTRGDVVQYALGIFIGMPLSALILTNKKEILEALKKKYKNFMEFFKDIKDAKKDQKIA